MYHVRESGGEGRCVHMMRYGACCCDCMSVFMVMHHACMRVCAEMCSWGGQVLLAWTVDVSCACDWFSGWLGRLFFWVCVLHTILRNLSYHDTYYI